MVEDVMAIFNVAVFKWPNMAIIPPVAMRNRFNIIAGGNPTWLPAKATSESRVMNTFRVFLIVISIIT